MTSSRKVPRRAIDSLKFIIGIDLFVQPDSDPTSGCPANRFQKVEPAREPNRVRIGSSTGKVAPPSHLGVLAGWRGLFISAKTDPVRTSRMSARPEFAVAWYRFRATFRHRFGGYLAIVVLIALVGGLAMGSIAAARRTASSFSVFWAHSNPSNLVGTTGFLNPSIGEDSGYNAALVKAISHLPHVSQVESQSGIDFLPLTKNGLPASDPNFYTPAAGNGYGSVNGLYFDQDRVGASKGRVADPNRPDELMLTAAGAAELGVHVGSVLPVGIYTNAETELPAFGTAKVKPVRIVDEHIVGIAVFNSSLVQDDVDAAGSPNNLFTPALTRQLLKCCVNYTETGIRVSGGAANVRAVQAELTSLLPKGFPPFQGAGDAVTDRAQRAIKPEALALGVFGAIVALAALLVAGQVTTRQLRLGTEEREVLRAVGAGSAMTSTDGLIGIGGAIVLGALLAAGVAVALSPLAPLGPVRPVYPYPGISFDWTVLGLGVLLLVVLLGAIAGIVSYREAPHRRFVRGRRSIEKRSSLVGAAEAAGLPAPAVAGARFALEAGSGRSSVPVRSAILGAAMAVLVLVATVTFGASLNSLVAHPALYGWNWDYILDSGGDIPERQVTTLLDRDPYISQWSAVYTGLLQIDGQNVPVIGESPGAKVAPPLLSGHGLNSAGQVVLGAVTLAQLHKHVGQSVEVSNGTSSARLQHRRHRGDADTRFVDRRPTPRDGHGRRAFLQPHTRDRAKPLQRSPPRPERDPREITQRAEPQSRAFLTQKIASATTNTANFGVVVSGVLHPAEIVNYRSLGATPVYLGAGLAIGAVGALALTLLASVRRRRRDLALLKTLGFTGRQLAAAVAWQSTIAVVIGTVVGVPLGIALGRWLWDLFATSIHAVPAPDVPALSVSLIALGALVLANLVAAIPGRLAARTPTALLLRSE